jgi:hypothetical protein
MMNNQRLINWLAGLGGHLRDFFRSRRPARPDLHTAWQHQADLPDFVIACPVAQRYLKLLGPLAWDQLPERDLQRNWGQPTIPYAAFSAACLVKLNEGQDSMGKLRDFILDHPALLWLLGFPLVLSNHAPLGFDPEASLPTARHLTRMLRTIPNSVPQFLLAETVRLIRAELSVQGISSGDCISLDTKHIIAWVKENNPKAYVTRRYDKTSQPKGDADCKLGCKRRRNRQAASQELPPTPRQNPQPAKTVPIGEFYWGYGSGLVATKVPDWGEFAVAELTQPFDRAEVTYFFPLMTTTEQRLGGKPRFGAFDAALDAFYVYAYFHSDQHDGFAAVPFAEKGGYKVNQRQFDQKGYPRCAAGLSMALKFTFIDRTRAIIEHERAKYVCPLRFPKLTGQPCPLAHPRWQKGGCTADMPTSIGARLRYQLDRHSPAYKQVYNQRTATERINAQAVALGIERPKLRNHQAIANLNTLIYTLINLRMLHRIRQRLAEND